MLAEGTKRSRIADLLSSQGDYWVAALRTAVATKKMKEKNKKKKKKKYTKEKEKR